MKKHKNLFIRFLTFLINKSNYYRIVDDDYMQELEECKQLCDTYENVTGTSVYHLLKSLLENSEPTDEVKIS